MSTAFILTVFAGVLAALAVPCAVTSRSHLVRHDDRMTWGVLATALVVIAVAFAVAAAVSR